MDDHHRSAGVSARSEAFDGGFGLVVVVLVAAVESRQDR